MTRLECIVCDGPCGTWHFNATKLAEVAGSMSRKAKCRHCGIHLVFTARYLPEQDAVGIFAVLTPRAKRDLAKQYEVPLNEVEEIVRDMQASQAEASSVRDPGLPEGNGEGPDEGEGADSGSEEEGEDPRSGEAG
jgi:hypothetical protein